MKKYIKTSLLAFAITSITTTAFAKNEAVEPYIIKFNDEYKGKIHIPKGLLRKVSSVKFKKTFKSTFSGITVDLTEKQVEKLSKLPFIEMIEKDIISKVDISWGQDRIDQRDLPLDNSFSVTNGGNGTNIYVIDSGININHSEFANRIGTVTSTISGGATNDCFGHGTHVAGIAAGSNFGVAPDATINSIRFTDCNGDGFTSDMIDAFEWVIDHGQPNSVINLSSTANSFLVSTALDSAIMSGHVVVTSAGNNSSNSCYDSSSKYKVYSALVVGSTTASDSRASTSNYGPCVNLFAPGENIIGPVHSNNAGFTTRSGTSMASPVVAGIAAGYRSSHPNATPHEVISAIVNSSSSGKLSGMLAGSPNKLAYNILSTPSVYWQRTEQIIASPSHQARVPFETCTAGQVSREAIGPTGYGTTYKRVWKCM